MGVADEDVKHLASYKASLHRRPDSSACINSADVLPPNPIEFPCLCIQEYARWTIKARMPASARGDLMTKKITDLIASTPHIPIQYEVDKCATTDMQDGLALFLLFCFILFPFSSNTFFETGKFLK